MIDWRELHAYIIRRQERAMNQWRREFAKECAAIFDRETRGIEEYDAATHIRVMRALEAALDAFYGQYPGDPSSRLLQLVAGGSRLAVVLAYRQAIADVRRHVSPAAMRRLQEGTDEQQGDRRTRAF